MRYLCWFLFGIFLSVSTNGRASKNAKHWKQKIKRANHLEKSQNQVQQRKAATLLFQVYKMMPKAFVGMLSMTRACYLRATLSKKNQDVTKWSILGLKYAERMQRLWPSRAEGYFWASINAGLYAKGGGVWAAITKGLVKKIEKNARKSFKINPHLYGGGAQRVLGRFYYKLPWPMRRLKKSLAFLRNAHKISPKHPDGMLFLAETLWAIGKKSLARQLLKRCAKGRNQTTKAGFTGQKCYKLLSKYK